MDPATFELKHTWMGATHPIPNVMSHLGQCTDDVRDLDAGDTACGNDDYSKDAIGLVRSVAGRGEWDGRFGQDGLQRIGCGGGGTMTTVVCGGHDQVR